MSAVLLAYPLLCLNLTHENSVCFHKGEPNIFIYHGIMIILFSPKSEDKVK